MPAGRPTVYQEHYPAKAFEFCAEFGFTDKKLARLFDVDERTINAWKKDHTDFSQSIIAGKDEFDSGKVEKSLLRRALGFSYTETTKELPEFPAQASERKDKDGLVVVKKVRKIVIPDVTAASRWLRNRRPERWPDKQNIDLTGDLSIELIDSFSEEDEEPGSDA